MAALPAPLLSSNGYQVWTASRAKLARASCKRVLGPISLKTVVQREVTRPDGEATSCWVSLTKAEQLEVCRVRPKTRAITCYSLREDACEYTCIPGQMSGGLKPDFNHQNDEFNCFIFLFSPRLRPAFLSALIGALDCSLHAFRGPKTFKKTDIVSNPMNISGWG